MYPEQVNNNYEGNGVFLYGLQGTSFYKETKENKVMKQLIDKSALVAEIEKRIKGLKDCHADTVAGYAGEISGLERLLSFIDTLETKEVDLEKELKTLDNTLFDLDGVAIAGATCYLTVEDVKDIAKHFYELGLIQKGE